MNVRLPLRVAVTVARRSTPHVGVRMASGARPNHHNEGLAVAAADLSATRRTECSVAGNRAKRGTTVACAVQKPIGRIAPAELEQS